MFKRLLSAGTKIFAKKPNSIQLTGAQREAAEALLNQAKVVRTGYWPGAKLEGTIPSTAKNLIENA